MKTRKQKEKRQKRMYGKADWKMIRREVTKRIASSSGLLTLPTENDLEMAIDRLVTIVNRSLKNLLQEQDHRRMPSDGGQTNRGRCGFH
jgi:hypothetical protein